MKFKTTQKFIICTGLAFLTLQSPKAFAEAGLCTTALQSDNLIRRLKPDYFDRFLTSNNKNRIVEVPYQADITNQGQRGFCHMYSLYAEFVREFKTRNKGQDPQISIYYWAYHYWLGRAIETAKDVKAGDTIPEGNWYEGTFDVVRKIGVMTQAQWRAMGGREDMHLASRDFVELGQLQSMVHLSHLDKEMLQAYLYPQVPKRMTRGDYFVNLNNNPALKTHLLDFIRTKRKLLKAGSTYFTKAQLDTLKDFADGKISDTKLTDDQKKEFILALNRDIETDIKNEFTSIFFGKPVNPLDSVDIQIQKKLAHEMFPELKQKTVTIAATGDRHGPLQYLGHQGDHIQMSAPLDKLASMVIDQINHKNSVWIGYDHNDYFVDSKTGAMTIEGMESKPVRAFISRAIRDLTDLYFGGHATQIVGYEVDANGQVVAFKMQNSWGVDVGRKGYYRMDISYFRAYIWRITIRDEQGIFTTDAINALENRAQQDLARTGQRKKIEVPF